VFGQCEDLKGWLALQAGLKTLLVSMRLYFNETRSSLGQTIFGTDDRKWPTPNFKLDMKVLPESWIKTCNLNDPWSVDAFGRAIGIVRELRNIEPIRSNVLRNLLFVWKMQKRFRILLCKKDERAIWLYGYWLGLLCRYEEVWWCVERVRRDYQAICMFYDQLRLHERPGSEGESWVEMVNELKLAPFCVYI